MRHNNFTLGQLVQSRFLSLSFGRNFVAQISPACLLFATANEQSAAPLGPPARRVETRRVAESRRQVQVARRELDSGRFNKLVNQTFAEKPQQTNEQLSGSESEKRKRERKLENSPNNEINFSFRFTGRQAPPTWAHAGPPPAELVGHSSGRASGRAEAVPAR